MGSELLLYCLEKSWQGVHREDPDRRCCEVDTTRYDRLIIFSTHLHLTVAVDMTASNGNPNQPNSLHFIHPHAPSPYVNAMARLAPLCLSYMAHSKIGALGFGAQTQPRFELSQCFNLFRCDMVLNIMGRHYGDVVDKIDGDYLSWGGFTWKLLTLVVRLLSRFLFFFQNGSATDHHVDGVKGLLDAYRYATMSVQPFAPTDYSEVIYFVSKFAKAESKRRIGLYFVLLILTDGGLANARRTIDALVDCSPHPISIIAVGIGPVSVITDLTIANKLIMFLPKDREFASLKALESPLLKHSDGRLLARQVSVLP
ncbi:unnamed protein product [Nippostrongylus brasiliensis]|uniref:Copine domain-containing protein n=1 Tax=Nippostrongylus brasiliensis TaxID=27835 RepID=A0A0N4Y7I9_NIPBR|nr:unnamed protein product [Nippostrongylus brasiliensis]